tara:strand:+ start:4533 stop:4712 length:180 start_codon:yes stop_codon:yes gene_type:complete
MNIDQAQERREKLEFDIKDAIARFESETGLEVYGVSFGNTGRLMMMGEDPRTVDVEVRL